MRKRAVGSGAGTAAFRYGSVPASWTATPRSRMSREAPTSIVAGSPSSSAARENGSRVTATSWLPSTAYAPSPASAPSRSWRPREQVAGDDDEVGPPLAHPVRRTQPCGAAAGVGSEVEVGEMRDAEPVQPRRQVLQLELEHACPQPPGLEPAVREGERRHCAEPDYDPGKVQGRRPPGSPAPKPPLQRGRRRGSPNLAVNGGFRR